MTLRRNNLSSRRTQRRELRKNLTPAEAKLWTLLKNRQLHGFRRRRQFSVGAFILDFYCPEKKLAVELDGHVHMNIFSREYGVARTAFLNRCGIRVLRFENWEVFDAWARVERIISEGLSGAASANE